MIRDGGGFGPLQDELTALQLCILHREEGRGGVWGVFIGQDIQPYACVASALQSRGLQDDPLGKGTCPGGPGRGPEVAQAAFIDRVGLFDAALLDAPEYVQRPRLQGNLGLTPARVIRDFILASPAGSWLPQASVKLRCRWGGQDEVQI